MRSMSNLLAVVALLLACLAPVTAANQPAERPNILLIISDDHAWTDYSFMGHPHIRTPNLDRLAAESLTFPRGYVTASLCAPSLATIITGLHPHQHNVTSNDPPLPKNIPRGKAFQSADFVEGRERMAQFIENAPTLPKLLGEQGYLSFQTGKWWHRNFRRGGFTHGMTHGNEKKGGRHGDAGLKIGREGMQPMYDFIETARNEQKPFFIWHAPFLPHDPHTPPERLLEKYRDKTPSIHVARYWAMVEWFDETCGELLDYLKKNGLERNTIVVYIADNGWIQDPDSTRFAPRSKQSQYDGGLRTPIMIHWPGRVQPRKSFELASAIDLAPTLLRAAGLEPPKNLPGLNLLDEPAVQARDILFGTCFTHDAVDLDDPARSIRWRWCLEGDWKLIVPDAQNEPDAVIELYNLSADPYELRNLAATQPDRVAALMKRLDAWWPGR
jgi:arylsulfatase A-like enzyme